MRSRARSGRWRVLGTGAALPGAPVETACLLAHIEARFGVDSKRLGARLASRIGVRTRYFCRDFLAVGEGPRPGDSNPELAASALRSALREAGLRANDLGYILAHTATPHTLLPSNAAWVADRLGYEGSYAELRQACTGFAHALHLGAGLFEGANQAPIAIVGSETGSVHLDPRRIGDDIGQLLNLVQMGDGAGAIVLGPDDGGPGPSLSNLYVGGLGPGRPPGFWMSDGGSGSPSGHGVLSFEHDFAGVRQRGEELFLAALGAARAGGVDLGSIDFVLPHQANATELPTALAAACSLSLDRVVVDADRVGNLGSASVWVALDRLRRSGRLGERASVLALGAEATKHLYGGFLYRHGSGDMETGAAQGRGMRGG